MTSEKSFVINWLITYIKVLFCSMQLFLLRAPKNQILGCFENVQLNSKNITHDSSFRLLSSKTKRDMPYEIG